MTTTETVAETPREKKYRLWLDLAEESVPHSFLKQNAMMNNFNKLGPHNISRKDKPPKGSKIIKERGREIIKKGTLTIVIPDYMQLINDAKTQGLKTSTFKLLDAIVLGFTSNGNDPDVCFSLKEYMEYCGLSDIKEARRQVNADLEILYAMSISCDDSAKKDKSRNYMDMRIIDDKGIQNGIVHAHLASKIAEMLSQCVVMPYPMSLLRIRSDKFPNAYYMLRRIEEHKFMNAGKANENIIAVKTLLEACPCIPTIEDVRQSQNREPRKRIVEPFLRDLEAVCEQIGLGTDNYSLTYAKGEEIPDEQLKELSYEVFIKAYVHFPANWPGYPDQTQRIAERKKEIAIKARKSAKCRITTKDKATIGS